MTPSTRVPPSSLGRYGLGDDLAVDSLDVLAIIVELESVFGIVVPERDLDRMHTVADLVHVVAKYLWERDHPEPFAPEHDAAA